MSKKRDYGSGAIEARGPNSWRLRYRVGGRLYRRTVKGTKSEAVKVLRQLLHSADTGQHVDPSRMTLQQWVTHWLSIGAPGRSRRSIGPRALERYEALLRVHVLPMLGDKQLQQIEASAIDAMYAGLDTRLSANTRHFVHIVLNSCLSTAVRTRKLPRNPLLDVAKAPPPAEADHGRALSAAELQTLLQGFKGSPLFLIVAVAAFTGARRSEILGLQWCDLDAANKMLRIERAVEETAKFGLRIKPPKSERGKRTIVIDNNLVALLVAERDKHLRIVAGVPDGADVDLSLLKLKLPATALMFPRLPHRGEDFSFTELRRPSAATKTFERKAAALGFPGLRFHDLRGSYATLLLDQGQPVHAVAARLGHDPAILLRSYAKKTPQADAAAAAVTEKLSATILKG